MQTCALCGKQAEHLGGHAWDYRTMHQVDLCHDQAMSCYHRWTVYNERLTISGSPSVGSRNDYRGNR